MNTIITPSITNATMRAVVVADWGDAERLQTAELPRPEPGLGEVRVAVHAAGLNPVDWWSRASGGFGLWTDPAILGWDVSGIVDAVGQGVSAHQLGDAVFGLPHFPAQAGTNAEYMIAPARQLAPKPPSLSHLEAAALPLAGLIAWQTLVKLAQVQAGQQVMIHAGGGGVGHLAIQIAKAKGAEVITTARSDKHALVRELGADTTIDPDEDWARVGIAADIVLDAIGGEVASRSLQILRDGGTLISIAGPWEPSDDVKAAAGARGIRTGFTLVEPDRHALIELTRLVEAGDLRPVISDTFQLKDLASAHRRAEQGHLAGKIVIQVR
jgi:NADPH:quinone reductase-like Zn-dependent oxidoreductase